MTHRAMQIKPEIISKIQEEIAADWYKIRELGLSTTKSLTTADRINWTWQFLRRNTDYIKGWLSLSKTYTGDNDECSAYEREFFNQFPIIHYDMFRDPVINKDFDPRHKTAEHDLFNIPSPLKPLHSNDTIKKAFLRKNEIPILIDTTFSMEEILLAVENKVKKAKQSCLSKFTKEKTLEKITDPFTYKRPSFNGEVIIEGLMIYDAKLINFQYENDPQVKPKKPLPKGYPNNLFIHAIVTDDYTKRTTTSQATTLFRKRKISAKKFIDNPMELWHRKPMNK